MQQNNGSGHSMPIHTIIPQETQIMGNQFLTPPSQHSYSGPMDNTPNHQLQVPDHPFLTPSPGSPDQWSSSSPHSNMSDWSEGISSPPTSIHSQMNLIPDQFKWRLLFEIDATLSEGKNIYRGIVINLMKDWRFSFSIHFYTNSNNGLSNFVFISTFFSNGL